MVMRLPKREENPRYGASEAPGPRLPQGTQVAGPSGQDTRSALAMLDMTIGDLIEQNKSQMSFAERAAASLMPSSMAKMPLRQALKDPSMSGYVRPAIEARLKDMGLTPKHLDDALKTPTAAPVQPPAAAVAPPAPAKQYALPPAVKPPAAAAPPVAAAAAPPVAPAGPAATAPAAAPAPVAAAPPAVEAGAAAAAKATVAAGGSPAAAKATYLEYLSKYGGHSTVMQDGTKTPVPLGTKGSYNDLDPELGSRLQKAGEAYKAATGKDPKFGEFTRGNDVQEHYWKESAGGTKYAAAAPQGPGHRGSNHLHGRAGDLPPGEFRDWLAAGNAKTFGLHFPVKGDAPHIEVIGGSKQADYAGPHNPYKAAAAEPVSPADQGPALRTAPAGGAPMASNPDALRAAFLSTIAKGEAKNYTTMYGGGQFSDMSKHPGQKVTANGYTSDAAGRYQFLGSTWAEQAKKYGYTDFSPKTQDLAAWNYAKDIYKTQTSRDLEKDLASNDPNIINGIGTALKGVWPSLPGGSQENWKSGEKFADIYGTNLTGYKPESGGDTPAAAPAAATADAGGGDFAKGMGGIGDIFGGIADSMSKSAAVNSARASSPANLPLPSLPTPLPMMPMIDPKQAEMQRQQLAMAMQRLNSGKLF